MARSQAELGNLQAPVFGIEALIADVNVNRDILIKILDEIELHGDELLNERVEKLAGHKREIDGRIKLDLRDGDVEDGMPSLGPHDVRRKHHAAEILVIGVDGLNQRVAQDWRVHPRLNFFDLVLCVDRADIFLAGGCE